MAYIPPNSEIKILANVPLDTSREHTLWFPDATTQYVYFNSKAKRTFTNASYVRKGRGVIKVQAPADELYDCNYMMYRNTSYSNKWFYAFCYVEYVNDTTSLITFAIDQIQTWFFNMNLKQSYVEREHASTDVAGDNLIPEGLETGEYIYGVYDNLLWSPWSIYVITTFDGVYDSNTQTWTFSDSGGGKTGGIYSGCEIYQFPVTSDYAFTEVSRFVKQATESGRENGIVNIFMFPKFTFSEDGYASQNYSFAKVSGSINGYTPRNNKLFTSPYCFLEVDNCEGVTAVFPQEYFSTSDCEFKIETTIGPSPSIALVPRYYKNRAICYPEAMYMTKPLTCSWNTDLYKAFMAQNLTASIVEDISDYVSHASTRVPDTVNKAADFGNKMLDKIDNYLSSSVNNKSGENLLKYRFGHMNASVPDVNIPSFNLQGSGVGTEGLATAVLGASALSGSNVLAGIYNDLSEMYAKAVKAPHNNGTNAGDLLVALQLKGFWFTHRTIRAEYAQIIDKYFDRYGYACHRIKVPNIHVRQNWTYTKTKGCEVEGSIPNEAKAEINTIFDSGITFWTYTATVGDYTQNNSIIS